MVTGDLKYLRGICTYPLRTGMLLRSSSRITSTAQLEAPRYQFFLINCEESLAGCCLCSSSTLYIHPVLSCTCECLASTQHQSSSTPGKRFLHTPCSPHHPLSHCSTSPSCCVLGFLGSSGFILLTATINVSQEHFSLPVGEGDRGWVFWSTLVMQLARG